MSDKKYVVSRLVFTFYVCTLINGNLLLLVYDQFLVVDESIDDDYSTQWVLPSFWSPFCSSSLHHVQFNRFVKEILLFLNVEGSDLSDPFNSTKGIPLFVFRPI